MTIAKKKKKKFSLSAFFNLMFLRQVDWNFPFLAFVKLIIFDNLFSIKSQKLESADSAFDKIDWVNTSSM